ncbi:MAG: acetyl-CoA carboxylase biotin carboxylase subunit, partial [Deltaproteobacteria bacterium]|nr:acetyl-CoA carboxylase biotin carboxylase subunit [Deltaproteobacteria bacterium]
AKLPLSQKDITFNGHAIELRVNAEDSVNLLPQSGKVHFYHQPSGFGVRVDSCLFSGAFVSPYYDSLLGKIILWAEDRDQCLKKALWALNEMAVVGVETNQKFIEKILCNEEFVRGTYTTTLVDNLLPGIES